MNGDEAVEVTARISRTSGVALSNVSNWVEGVIGAKETLRAILKTVAVGEWGQGVSKKDFCNNQNNQFHFHSFTGQFANVPMYYIS